MVDVHKLCHIAANVHDIIQNICHKRLRETELYGSLASWIGHQKFRGQEKSFMPNFLIESIRRLVINILLINFKTGISHKGEWGWGFEDKRTSF